LSHRSRHEEHLRAYATGVVRAALVVLVAPLAACGVEEAAAGGPGQVCFPNATCNAGLTCDPATYSCRAENGPQGDCRDRARSCFAPAQCLASAKTGAFGCRIPATKDPTCSGSPTGQVVPFVTTPEGRTVHWVLNGGCIAVSYEPALAIWSNALAVAARAWTDVDCAGICLAPPVQNAVAPDAARGEQRIHVRLGDVTSWPAVTESYFEQDSGRAIAAEVVIDRSRTAEVEASDFLRLIGHALFLAEARGDSIMAPVVTPRRTVALTANDRRAICTLYGVPSYCGE
jgi:hypothetical protein